MFQVDKYVERSTLSTQGMNPPSDASLRDRITATIIREEASEPPMKGVYDDTTG